MNELQKLEREARLRSRLSRRKAREAEMSWQNDYQEQKRKGKRK